MVNDNQKDPTEVELQPNSLSSQSLKKEGFWHRHLLAVLISILLVTATIGIVYYIFSSVTQVETTGPVHHAKIDSTSDWKTYTNELYGFEFRYPSKYPIDANKE